MSLDKMARELLMPLYNRIQTLERDAAAMQKLVGQMALDEERGVTLNAEQKRVVMQALDIAISKSGPEVHCAKFAHVLAWLRQCPTI